MLWNHLTRMYELTERHGAGKALDAALGVVEGGTYTCEKPKATTGKQIERLRTPPQAP